LDFSIVISPLMAPEDAEGDPASSESAAASSITRNLDNAWYAGHAADVPGHQLPRNARTMRWMLVAVLLLSGCSQGGGREPSRFELAKASAEIQKARLVIGDCANALAELNAADAKGDSERSRAASEASSSCAAAELEAKKESLEPACVGVAADGHAFAEMTRVKNITPAELTSYRDSIDRCYAVVVLKVINPAALYK
jgi:hypothetical protein